MMDDNNFIDTWMVGLTICVITTILMFGGLFASAHPDSLIKVILIALLSIAAVVVLSFMLTKRLNNHKDNQNGGLFIRVIYNYFAQQ